ncbi:threonine/serine dehydratase [Stella sp.]|uniref:threonine ammonia-lyase n=1 Tax=Stella sp. TaxID=2912054 RepID=UPI0035AEC028
MTMHAALATAPIIPPERLPPLAAGAPDIGAIDQAAERIRGEAVLTPLLEVPAANAILGGRLLMKAEMLQRTGSFKFRGAYNSVAALPPEVRARGVVTYSSGNHAQGLAAAAQAAGIPALIVMPADAPAIKVENTRGYGAEVVFYDRYTESREELGERLAAERGATIIRPYDEPNVIAGQGTCGLEIAMQAAAKGVRLDAVLVPAGGGGLVAGVSTAIAARSPGTPVYCCEPAGFDDTTRSLAAAAWVENDPAARSFCDALLAPTPGRITFTINARRLAGGLVVTDDEVAEAMRFAFRHFKVVVEPGGAVALAAVLAGRIAIAGRTIAVICSGGNVDPALYREVLAGG